jgi:ABC-type nickel/cobalt efflux system permease component RcnA
MRRIVAAAMTALALVPLLAGQAAAHPLGNYTVNRAVAVVIDTERADLTYIVDMAEIPALAEIEAIDTDGDGSPSRAEARAYAEGACQRIGPNLRVELDGAGATPEAAGAPVIAFSPGAAGLLTLRLDCTFAIPLPDSASRLAVADLTDDGHVGWREVTIAPGPGVSLTDADVPADSPSAHLTSYPTDRLLSPPDVRQGQASFVRRSGAAGAAPGVAMTQSGGPRSADPLTALVGGALSPGVVVVGLLVAAGLGIGHALSPGHGKTLVAAYLVGGRGTMRQAAVLGLTVAGTHTAGVLVLGVLILVAGELLLPEVVIGWLTIASGTLMAVLGAGLLWRALVSRRTTHSGDHAHSHPHPHGHDHPHPHSHPHSHPHGPDAAGSPTLSVRAVALLGVAGGLVPSASALIVLLAAVTTGRLLFGLALITAFGAGMAAVLAGLAIASSLARGWLDRPSLGARPVVQRALVLLPIGSGALVLGIGLAIAISAATGLG